MDSIAPRTDFSDPVELAAYAQSISDITTLQDLYEIVSRMSSDEWRFSEAYLLWRLGRGEILFNFLENLPSRFTILRNSGFYMACLYVSLTNLLVIFLMLT